jgi:hypothetical protein
MPSPGGMDDPGGNPLQEGIWGSIDGGWQNRMKRDESFASVQAAENPYDPMRKWVEDAEQMERERQFVEGPGPRQKERQFSPWDKGPDQITPEEAHFLYAEDPNRFMQEFGKYPRVKEMMAFDVGDKPAHSEEWLGEPTSQHAWHPGDVGSQGGRQGRGLIDHNGQLHLWSEDEGLHKEYMRRHRIPGSSVEFTVSPEGQVDVSHGFDPQQLTPYMQQLQQAGLTYDPNYDPFAEFDDFNFMNNEDKGDLGVTRAANNREKIYLPWSRETSSVEHDFEVEQVVPPGPHTEEVDYGDSTPLILQHDDPQLLDHAKHKLESSTKLSFLPLLLGLGAGALAGEGAAAMGAGALGQLGARAAVGHLVRGALNGQPGGAPGGAPAAQPAPQEAMPEQMLASVHNSLLAGFDGPFDNHPSSDDNFNERADGDPEDTDPNEVNDGDRDHWQRDQDVNDQGGTDAFTPDVIQALEDAEPALLHYFNSQESGANDPAIQKLIEALERDHPGLLDQEADPETIDFVNKNVHTGADAGQMGVPGIGGFPAPGTQQLQSPVAQPQQQVNPMTQASCPHCGARLTAGQGVCPQCNGSVSLAPNAGQEGAYPMGQQPMPAQPGMGGGVVARQAANQGPHNPEQFQAVANYLRQNGQEDQIQDLIDHPENYGDILAQIQGKGQPPQPDPDPGPPPPMPPGGAMPPGAMPPGGAPPGMPMQAAADGITPACPNCGSHTTGLISDEGTAQCSNCNHKWQTDFEVQGEKTPVQPKAANEHQMDYPDNWVTTGGAPLEVGKKYEMHSAKYDIPDIVRIESIKPDEIEYTLTGPYNLAHRTAISREEAEMDGLTFDEAGPDENDTLNEQGPNEQMEAPTMAPAYSTVKRTAGPHDFMGPVHPEEHALQSQNYPPTRNAPYEQCPGCGVQTKATLGGCPHCGTPMGVQQGGPIDRPLDEWAHDTVTDPTMPQPLEGYHTAGQKYTPMEQREFIDEPGVARNSDKLDLEGTHYTEQPSLTDDLFLFGL